MAVGARVAGALPLAGATVAAVALAGVAVFTVQKAGCVDPGHYVQHDDGQVELVGSCIPPEHLPPAYEQHEKDRPRMEPATNELTRKSVDLQAP